MEGNEEIGNETRTEQYESADTSQILAYLNLETEYIELYQQLTGKRWDIDAQKFKDIPGEEPLVSKPAGIQWILRVIKPYFSKSATVNDLTDERINIFMRQLSIHLKNVLISDNNRERFGINTYDIDIIIQLVRDYCHLNLNRSANGNELNAITKMTKSTEIHKQSAASQGFSLGKFLPFGIGGRK